jgi:branched-chain amino acid transport system substrate-binding protein
MADMIVNVKWRGLDQPHVFRKNRGQSYMPEMEAYDRRSVGRQLVDASVPICARRGWTVISVSQPAKLDFNVAACLFRPAAAQRFGKVEGDMSTTKMQVVRNLLNLPRHFAVRISTKAGAIRTSMPAARPPSPHVNLRTSRERPGLCDRTTQSIRTEKAMLQHSFRQSASTLRILFGIAGVLLLSVATTPARAEIKIGFQAPLTGSSATDGKSAQIAATMAVEDINAAGGVLGQKIELITYDDQAKSDQAIFTANKLIGEDGVKLVVNGSYSASGRAAAPVFQKAGVVMISAYGVHPDITRAGDYMFRLVHLGEPQGAATALYVGETLGIKKVSTITMDNDYGQATMEGFLQAAGKYGIEVVNKYSYSLKDRQFGSIVASVKRDNPDAIYATGYFFTGGPLVSQLRAAGITVPIIGSQAFDSEKFVEIAGPAADGTYIIDSFDRDRKDEALQKFFAEFKNRAGYAPEGVAAITYSAIRLMADGIKRANSTDPDKVRDALATTKNFPLLEGTMNGFNSLHEMIMPIRVNVIKDGKFKSAGEITDIAPPEK